MTHPDKKILIKILIAVCAISAACDSAKKKDDFVMRNAKQARHPNGLTVKMPEGYIAKQTDDGFVVEPENNNLRVPIDIYVSIIRGEKEAEQNSNFRTTHLAGKTIRYSIEKGEGGSGGESYSLTAYETVAGGFIKYSQSTQSEFSEPDFALAWQIIENAYLNQ